MQHLRTARHVRSLPDGVTRALEAVAAMASANASSSSAPSRGGASHDGGGDDAGGSASADNSHAMTGQYNELAAKLFNVALLLALAAFMFCIAPSIASYFANGRFTQGWRLGRHKAKSDEAISPAPLAVSKSETFTTVNIPASPQIKRVPSFYAALQYWYNRVLLPNAPFLKITRGQVVVVLGYQGLVVGFMFWRAGNLVSNYNRPGYLSVAQLPAVFLLATRNNLLSITGKGYERLNFLHRVGGRMVVLCGLLHTVLFYRASSGHTVDYSDPTIYTGVVAAVPLVILLLTSLPWIRRALYQSFVVSHIIGWIAFVVAVSYHAPDMARPYIAFSVAMFKAPTMAGELDNTSWVRVFVGRRMLEAHPFTIANAPKSGSPLPGQQKLTVFCKTTGQWTKGLYEHANAQKALPTFKEGCSQAFGLGNYVRVTIEGPYGGLMYKDLTDSQAVLLIAGGSGITAIAALLEDLVRRTVDGDSSVRLVSVAWIMKDIECVDWFSDLFQGLVAACRERTSLELRLQFFVTGSGRFNYVPVPGAIVHHSRPNIPSLVDETVSATIRDIDSMGLTTGGGLMVSACGPESLNCAVRSAVAGVPKLAALKIGGVVAHTEGFSL